jgi:hypothetical protein
LAKSLIFRQPEAWQQLPPHPTAIADANTASGMPCPSGHIPSSFLFQQIALCPTIYGDLGKDPEFSSCRNRETLNPEP